MQVYKLSSTAGTMLFDTASVKQVLTPSSTGVTITNATNGSTYNWLSEDSDSIAMILQTIPTQFILWPFPPWRQIIPSAQSAPKKKPPARWRIGVLTKAMERRHMIVRRTKKMELFPELLPLGQRSRSVSAENVWGLMERTIMLPLPMAMA